MAAFRRNEPIAAWQDGDTVEGFALLARKEVRRDRGGRSYLDLDLADASGTMVAKAWPDSPAFTGTAEARRFVALRGVVRRHREQLQLVLEECREATAADREAGFDEARLVPTTREDLDDLWRRAQCLFGERIERPLLRRLGEEALAVHGPELRLHPAARAMHHAYRGGLLEHVVAMGELAVRLSAQYRELDRDLLLLGVLFHDLGKLRELTATPPSDYTLRGRLVGHVVLGRDLLRQRCAAIPGFPADLELVLEHLVLAHQGRREFGAPVEPMTAEAIALHFLDDLDSKLNQFRLTRSTSAPGPQVQWHRGLGRWVYLGVPASLEDAGQETTPAPVVATKNDG
jgi:3'-5' exoribonuclease